MTSHSWTNITSKNRGWGPTNNWEILEVQIWCPLVGHLFRKFGPCPDCPDGEWLLMPICCRSGRAYSPSSLRTFLRRWTASILRCHSTTIRPLERIGVPTVSRLYPFYHMFGCFGILCFQVADLHDIILSHHGSCTWAIGLGSCSFLLGSYCTNRLIEMIKAWFVGWILQ